MSLVEIKWHPSDRQLHTFGVSGLLASAVAAFFLHRLWSVAILWSVVVLVIGAGILLCSLVAPRITRILYLGLTIAALPIGLVVSFLLLAAFYFLIVTPLAMIFRLIGRDALCRRFDSTTPSYWVPHKSAEEAERYFHQF
jgi:hypothetical protein